MLAGEVGCDGTDPKIWLMACPVASATGAESARETRTRHAQDQRRCVSPAGNEQANKVDNAANLGSDCDSSSIQFRKRSVLVGCKGAGRGRGVAGGRGTVVSGLSLVV